MTSIPDEPERSENHAQIGVYREDLVGRMVGLEYNAEQRIGLLWLAPHTCTDMTGAINLFKAIDPNVRLVLTFQVSENIRGPGVPDTAYARDPENGQWRSTREAIASARLEAAGLMPLSPSKLIMGDANGGS